MNFIIVKIFKPLWKKKHKEKNEIQNRIVSLWCKSFSILYSRSNLVEEGRLHECLSQCVHLVLPKI